MSDRAALRRSEALAEIERARVAAIPPQNSSESVSAAALQLLRERPLWRIVRIVLTPREDDVIPLDTSNCH